MALGLIFGSFNPLHNGHIQIANEAINKGIVDEVCFILAKQNPFKQPYEIVDHHRVHMLTFIRYLNEKCFPSTIEFSKEIPDSRTFNVLEYFKKSCPNTELVIICGSDTYNEIPKWYKGKELLKEKFYIVPRTLGAVSSSEIRDRIKHGKKFKHLVPIQIYNYIKEHNLYINSTNHMLTLQELKVLKQNNRENLVIYRLLATIIGECEQISKDPSHDDIIRVLQKIYKDNNTTLDECSKDRINQIQELEEENKFILQFLPTPLSYAELFALINTQMTQNKRLPDIMKYLSINYKGRYQSKEAIKIINSLL